MATVALTPVIPDRSGAIATTTGTACSAGSTYTFANSGNQVVRVVSTAVDTALVALLSGVTNLDGATVPTKALLTPGTTTDVLVGPFPTAFYSTLVTLSGPVAATTKLTVIQFVPNQ